MRFCGKLSYLKWYFNPICKQEFHPGQFCIGLNALQLQRQKHSTINSDKNNELKEKILIENKDQEEKSMPAAFSQKYKVFRDTESPQIFDVEEERLRLQQQQQQQLIEPIDIANTEIKTETIDSEYEALNMKRKY